MIALHVVASSSSSPVKTPLDSPSSFCFLLSSFCNPSLSAIDLALTVLLVWGDAASAFRVLFCCSRGSPIERRSSSSSISSASQLPRNFLISLFASAFTRTVYCASTPLIFEAIGSVSSVCSVPLSWGCRNRPRCRITLRVSLFAVLLVI